MIKQTTDCMSVFLINVFLPFFLFPEFHLTFTSKGCFGYISQYTNFLIVLPRDELASFVSVNKYFG